MAWQPDYVTPEEMRRYVDIGDLDDDAHIGLAIATASRDVDDHCNRQFGLVAAPEERFYTARPDYARGCSWIVDVDDFQTVTGLVVEVGGDPVSTFTKVPINAAAEGRPWTGIQFTDASEITPTGEAHQVGVVARWGWTEVPDQVKQATSLQANRLLKRRQAPFGIAGSPESGSEMRLLSRLDPDAHTALRGLPRIRKPG